MPVAFVSHSSEDKVQATALVEALRARGVDPWIDHEQIKLGESIPQRITEGLAASDVVLVLISRSSVASPWCRREYQSPLMWEIDRGKTIIIPVRLDDTNLPPFLGEKRYVDLRDPNSRQSIDELAQRIRELVHTSTGSGRKEVEASLTGPVREIVTGLLFLLLLDQYPEGAWGRSLTETAGAYDHEEDPGSISVSYWAAEAIASVLGRNHTPEIDKFDAYLRRRRNKSSGAIGMRKDVGSAWKSWYEIVPNMRHTALGARFLKDFGNSLDLALHSLSYVISGRTPQGAWAATGPATDGNADPLTTAYVLQTLRQFDQAGFLAQVTIPNKDEFLQTYWASGLLWLYRFLLTNGMLWPYAAAERTATQAATARTFCDTADVLMALPQLANFESHANAHRSVIDHLVNEWDKNGTGIPTGPGQPQANLETTVQFTRALCLARDVYPALSDKTVRRFISSVEPLLVSGSSNAAGWAATVTLLAGDLDLIQVTPDDLDRLRVQVTNTWSLTNKTGPERAIEELADLPAWVVSAAAKQILCVSLTPP